MLTQAQVKELFHYDPCSGNLIWINDHKANKVAGKVAGCIQLSYIRIKIYGNYYLAHRLIWLWHYGYFPKNNIDHINGVGTDNRIKNLREANHSQNMQNQQKAQKNNKSGYLGVSPSGKKWKARIFINNKEIYIGSFSIPEDAHKAYLAKKREIHPFGRL